MIYSEREADATKAEYRRAVKAAQLEKIEKMEREEEEHARLEFKRYRKEQDAHGMLFTDLCPMANDEIDEAMEGLSENQRLVIVKRQWNMWVWGAGWKDVRVAFSRKGIDFDSDHLIRELNKMIAEYVYSPAPGFKPRPIRAMVPRPSRLASVTKLPSLGDELCDALEMQRISFEEEGKRLENMHEELNIPRRHEDMPDLEGLVGKKVAIAYWNRSEKDGSVVLRFHPGTVKKVTNVTNTECTALMEWDEGAEDSEEKLEETTWAGLDNTLGYLSWKLA